METHTPPLNLGFPFPKASPRIQTFPNIRSGGSRAAASPAARSTPSMGHVANAIPAQMGKFGFGRTSRGGEREFRSHPKDDEVFRQVCTSCCVPLAALLEMPASKRLNFLKKGWTQGIKHVQLLCLFQAQLFYC